MLGTLGSCGLLFGSRFQVRFLWQTSFPQFLMSTPHIPTLPTRPVRVTEHHPSRLPLFVLPFYSIGCNWVVSLRVCVQNALGLPSPSLHLSHSLGRSHAVGFLFSRTQRGVITGLDTAKESPYVCSYIWSLVVTVLFLLITIPFVPI